MGTFGCGFCYVLWLVWFGGDVFCLVVGVGFGLVYGCSARL